MEDGLVPESRREGGGSSRPRCRRWLFGSVLAIVVLAVAVVLIAQGGGGGGPLNAIAKAAEVTQREPGGRALFHVSIESTATPGGITEDGSMTFNEGGRTEVDIHIDLPEQNREEEMVGVTEGSKAYISSELFNSLPAGKKWMEIDVAVKGADGSTIPEQTGPTEGLKTLEQVIGAKQVGKEDIEGVATTHYTGTLPTGREVLGVKPDIAASSIDVWIDAQDRIRKMRMRITGSLKEGDPSATTDMTINFVEFGREPAIQLPPQSEVFDATGLVESEIRSQAE